MTLAVFAMLLVVPPPVSPDLPLAGLPETWRLTGGWQILEGDLQRMPAGLAAGPGRMTALLESTPRLASGTITIDLEPVRRSGQANWAVAGVSLFEAPDRFWQLGLVEDPDRRTRRIELIENLDGVWQAQNEAGTRLEARQTGNGTWEYGEAYRLELAWDAEGVTGRVRQVDAAEWQWQVRFAWPAEVAAVRAGRAALRSDSLDTVYRSVTVRGVPVAMPPAGARAALLGGDGPWADARWRETQEVMAGLLAAAGYTVQTVATEAIAPVLAADEVSLLAAPSLERLPEEAFVAIADFVRRGGDLFASGGEPFATPLKQAPDGRWMPRAEALTAAVKPRIILRPAETAGLRRTGSRPQSPPVIRTGVPGPTGLPDALGVSLPEFDGWDILSPPEFEESPFAAGETLTVLTARGTPGQMLSVEWKEEDGSRWMAAVRLADRWQTYVLAAADFKFWRDGSPLARELTTFRPENARTLAFGPASSHGSRSGPTEYAVGPLGVAANPWPGPPFETPIIETISPWYKQYETRRDGEAIRLPIARAPGLTMAPEPEGRWDTTLGRLGFLTRYVTAGGSQVFWLPSSRLDQPRRDALSHHLRRAAAGIVLLNGGPRDVVQLVGESLRAGARVMNSGGDARSCSLRFSIVPQGRPTEATVTVPPGGIAAEAVTLPVELPPGEYSLVTELFVDGVQMDAVQSPFRVVDPAAPRTDGRRISVADGHFVARGRRVFLHGVNYWPRYVSGQELGRFWSHWLTPRNYNPELVEADLRVLEALGMNLISVQYSSPDMARPMADLAARCRAHGIWLNVFTGAANSFDPERDRRLLEAAMLDGNDVVFAHDLLWEPHLGPHEERRRIDVAWRAWIDEQYGGLAVAERTWEFAAPRDADGSLINPTDEMLAGDGPHRRYIAAYRRFVDDHVSRHYGRVARHLRLVDPEVLLGVRTGYGGTGQQWPNRVMAYDLLSGAAHLDFTSPEGYGLPPDFEQGRSTGFITAYGRWAGNGKPVFWSEFGRSIGPRGGDEQSREDQRLIWETMLRVIEDSGADASAGWWWPGGWRLGEESDYGVLEPDGTPRPTAVTAGEIGRRLDAEPPRRDGEPLALVCDRDLDVRGTHGLWEQHGGAYVAAREAGREVIVRTPGTGSNTATMPRVQVGNAPYNGTGPLTYANAEIGWIRAVWDGGERLLDNGDTLRLPPGTRVELAIELVNTGEATWLPAAAGEGGCAMVVEANELGVAERVPRYGRITLPALRLTVADGATAITGRLTVAGLGRFGELLRLRLEPEPGG